jgi:Flp pilus assembly protein TadG
MRGKVFQARRGAGCRRHGTTALQLALVLPLLLVVMFGVVEFGQYLYIRAAFEAAARDAARAAELHYAVQADPATAATNALTTANVTFNSSWMTITDQTTAATVSDVSTVSAGDTLNVAIAATYAQIPNAMEPLFKMTGVGIGNSRLCSGNCTVIKQ